MCGDGFTIEACQTDSGATDDVPAQPRLRITFDGSPDQLKQVFRGPDAQGYTPTDLDFFYRHVESDHPASASGKFGVADRASGAYVFEVRVHPSVVETVVRAVTASDRSSRYQVELRTESARVSVFEKETLLVYDASGTLCRERSLIPGHVEI